MKRNVAEKNNRLKRISRKRWNGLTGNAWLTIPFDVFIFHGPENVNEIVQTLESVRSALLGAYQGCQMVYFQTKKIGQILEGLAMEYVGII
jgi:hypothetical protein